MNLFGTYPQTDIFILLFSLISPASLENIQNLWIPEIKQHCPNIKYILVGSNSKLRDSFQEHLDEYKSNGWEPVPSEKGEEMCRLINAENYIECDPDSLYNVKEVFEAALEAFMNDHEGGNKKDHKTKKVSKFQQWKEKRKEKKKSKKD